MFNVYCFSLSSTHEVGFDEGVELAVHYSGDVAGLVVGAVVLDAAVVEDVGAYLAAPLNLFLAGLYLGLCCLAAFELTVVEVGAQQAHGVVAVFELFAALGVLDEYLFLFAGLGVGVLVAQSDASLHLVDVLPSGAGGQNVNKVETGVRLRYQYTDPETGEQEEILIENTESRKQLENRNNAMRLLRSNLYDRELKRRQAAQAKIEAGKKKIEWGSQIRSYVFDDRRVKDHRTNYQTSDVAGVMDGKLDPFIKAYLMSGGE